MPPSGKAASKESMQKSSQGAVMIQLHWEVVLPDGKHKLVGSPAPRSPAPRRINMLRRPDPQLRRSRAHGRATVAAYSPACSAPAAALHCAGKTRGVDGCFFCVLAGCLNRVRADCVVDLHSLAAPRALQSFRGVSIAM